MHDKIRDRLNQDEYQDIRHLSEDWHLMRRFYMDDAKGPAKLEIAEHEVYSKLFEDFELLNSMVKQDYES